LFPPTVVSFNTSTAGRFSGFDTAWNLFQRLSREQTERYLENHRLKGSNVIQA